MLKKPKRLKPFGGSPAYAVIIRAIHGRGETQREALAEIDRHGLRLRSTRPKQDYTGG